MQSFVMWQESLSWLRGLGQTPQRRREWHELPSVVTWASGLKSDRSTPPDRDHAPFMSFPGLSSNASEERRQAANRRAAATALSEMMSNLSNEAGWWFDATRESVASLPVVEKLSTGACTLVGEEAERRHSRNREKAQSALSEMVQDVSRHTERLISRLDSSAVQVPVDIPAKAPSFGDLLCLMNNTRGKPDYRDSPSVVTWASGIRPRSKARPLSAISSMLAPPEVVEREKRQEANRRAAVAALSEMVSDVQAGCLAVGPAWNYQVTAECADVNSRQHWARLPSVVTWASQATLSRHRQARASARDQEQGLLMGVLHGEQAWAALVELTQITEEVHPKLQASLGQLPLPALHLGGNLGRVEVEGAGIIEGRSRDEVAAWLEVNSLADLAETFEEARIDGAALTALAKHWDQDPSGFAEHAEARFACSFAMAMRLGAALSRVHEFKWPARDPRKLAHVRRRAARVRSLAHAMAARVSKEAFDSWHELHAKQRSLEPLSSN